VEVGPLAFEARDRELVAADVAVPRHVVGERRARDLDDLESAHDPAHVAGLDA
jgi:hypothetical protein